MKTREQARVYDACVVYGVKKDTNERKFYIGGVGQLCSECYFNVYSK